jgi:hypothetical protein
LSNDFGNRFYDIIALPLVETTEKKSLDILNPKVTITDIKPADIIVSGKIDQRCNKNDNKYSKEDRGHIDSFKDRSSLDNYPISENNTISDCQNFLDNNTLSELSSVVSSLPDISTLFNKRFISGKRDKDKFEGKHEGYIYDNFEGYEEYSGYDKYEGYKECEWYKEFEGSEENKDFESGREFEGRI